MFHLVELMADIVKILYYLYLSRTAVNGIFTCGRTVRRTVTPPLMKQNCRAVKPAVNPFQLVWYQGYTAKAAGRYIVLQREPSASLRYGGLCWAWAASFVQYESVCSSFG